MQASFWITPQTGTQYQNKPKILPIEDSFQAWQAGSETGKGGQCMGQLLQADPTFLCLLI